MTVAMATLSNPRHERFAQELAKGKTADEAYQLAGYAENRHNASRLKTNEHILGRVAEIQSRAAERVEITVASVTENLTRIAKDAESLTGQQKPAGLAVARAAWMDAAKLNGLVVDRKEVRTGDLDGLNADERKRLRDAIERELERRAGDAEPTGQSKPAGTVSPLH